MPKIQLADFQETISKKYEDFEVFISDTETVTFSPALRLNKAKRRELAAVLDVETRAQLDTDDDVFDVYKDAFRVSEKNAGDFDRLESAVGDDPAVWQELFLNFVQDTQAGEA